MNIYFASLINREVCEKPIPIFYIDNKKYRDFRVIRGNFATNSRTRFVKNRRLFFILTIKNIARFSEKPTPIFKQTKVVSMGSNDCGFQGEYVVTN